MVRLHSPYIVKLYGKSAEPPRSNYSIVMEFMAGGTLLAELIDPKRELKWGIRYNYGLDIAKGIAYLHDKNIIHRDLKSTNVLLDGPKEHAKISDFDLSMEADLITLPNAGTAPYMAPELFDNETSNKSTDVYSFAIILWEIATRKMAREGCTIPQLAKIVAVLETREDIPPETPPSMARLIQGCWEQRAEQRPPIDECVTEIEKMSTPNPGR